MLSNRAERTSVVPPDLVDWTANRLVAAHIRNIPAITLGSLLNLVVVSAALWGDVDGPPLALASGGLLALILHRLWLARGISRRSRRANARRVARAFTMNALAVGIGVALGSAAFLPLVGAGDRLLLGLAVATQLAATAYTMRTLPAAARCFIVPSAIGLCLGLARIEGIEAGGAVILVAAYTGLMLHMVDVAHALFVTRILRERELNSANRTVTLLLNEYEQSGSDWLFELNADARLTRVSDRFAQAAGQPLQALEGQPLADIFAAGEARDHLLDRLAGRQAFRHLELALRAGESTAVRWWSVSCRPVYAASAHHVAFRGVIGDITGQKQAESRVRYMAHYDSLTGLPNRALFDLSLKRMLTAASDAQVALIIVDLDEFKSVNDLHGHPVGDALLRAASEAMRSSVRRSRQSGEGHLVARLGGDEFAVIICGVDAGERALRLADELLADLSSTFEVENHMIDISASIGIALAPDHALVPQQLLVNADIALHAAKSAGRNRWEMFTPGMDLALHEKHLLSRDLRHAAAQDELRLYLQPLIDLPSGRTTGYEALLRWQHPVRGMVGPGQFIHIAEETGLIEPIGEWVIREALREAARWTGGETVAINLSPVQLGSPNLLPVIAQALAATGVNPERVELEITESVLMENSVANLQMLGRLRDLGVNIALDDFGTGYASLNYLLTFPFDKIKIDRSFVAELAHRPDSQTIVGAVIGLANRLGMVTLAEGVEHAEQLAILRAQGCQMGQGWLFGAAVPASEYVPVPASANVVAIKPARRPARRSGTA